MKLRVWATALILLAGGCETLEGAYVAESETMLEGDGVRIYEDVIRDAWGGETLQYRAFNSNDFAVCAQVTLDGNAQTSGHSMGGIFRVPAGQEVDIGYVVPPAQFDLSSQYWTAQDNGECGYPPN